MIASHRPPPEPAPHLHRCKCGACYDAPAFAALAVVETLGAAQLSSIVVSWPPSTVVDVRACSACGGAIARLSRV
jgi:hypothetical protein